MTSESAATVAEHQHRIRRLLAETPLDRVAGRVEHLPVNAAAMAAHPERYRDRVLAEDVDSLIDLPPFTNSQMDGYAIRSVDVTYASQERVVRMPVAEEVAAGASPRAHESGTATPIMTGAPLPRGADAIVPVERTTQGTFQRGSATAAGASVGFTAPVAAGTFVRTRGSDLRQGDRLLTSGRRLHPADWAALAASGLTSVAVVERACVLVVSTGAELAAPGSALPEGGIHDANLVTLTMLCAELGCSIQTVQAAHDDPARLWQVVSAHPAADLVITAGGISAGAHEVVREALGPRGVRFGHVAMQPGGPQGWGTIPFNRAADPAAGATSGSAGAAVLAHTAAVPVIALPGNPVSVLVSFEMFVRPVLRRILQLPAPERPRVRARLAAALDSPAGKHQVLRGVLRRSPGSVADTSGALEGGQIADPAQIVEIVGGSSSHLLATYTRANALVHVPVGVTHLDAGDEVEVWRIRDQQEETNG